AVEAVVPPPVRPASSVQRTAVAIPGKAQADIVLGVPGFSRLSQDYYSAMMADLILGRLGLMGRLGASVRDEEGLAYYVYSQAQAGFLAGPWAVHAGVSPRNVERAVEGIVREIRGLQREPVRGGELRDARRVRAGRQPPGAAGGRIRPVRGGAGIRVVLGARSLLEPGRPVLPRGDGGRHAPPRPRDGVHQPLYPASRARGILARDSGRAQRRPGGARIRDGLPGTAG